MPAWAKDKYILFLYGFLIKINFWTIKFMILRYILSVDRVFKNKFKEGVGNEKVIDGNDGCSVGNLFLCRNTSCW